MPADVKAILSLEVPLIVVLAERQMKVADVINLATGSIIELGKSAEDELTVQVANKAIGTGLAVKVGENFGVRLTYIGDLKSRIMALGQGGGSSSGSGSGDSGDAETSSLADAMLAGR
jgi:flagellar motor switch protein FliN/FliY